MEAIHVHAVVQKDGEITVTGLPFKKGESVELVVQPEPTNEERRPFMTARQLLESGLIGLWADRTDIGDSAEFARQLREKAQRRW